MNSSAALNERQVARQSVPGWHAWVVWGVWAIMLLTALMLFLRFGRNIPLAEDWQLVAPFTGNEPNFWQWLWSQNNEHRVPLPRLIMLALLAISHGDFRSGMLFNIATLALLAAAMMLAARRIRGYSHIADVFFPLLILHAGNWENLFWTWQLSFVVSIELVAVYLLILVLRPAMDRPIVALAAGVILLLLPLTGATGLLFVPLLAIWNAVCGWRQWRKKGSALTIGLLWGASVTAGMVTLLYFVGYVHPPWNPPNPGLLPSIVAAMQFLVLGWGPAAIPGWAVAFIVSAALVALTFGWLLLQLRRLNEPNRHQAIGILVFLSNMALFTVAMGYGRAAHIQRDNFWPLRYVLLSALTLCAVYFCWLIFGRLRWQMWIPTVMAVIIAAALVPNHLLGLRWGDWYRDGMLAIENDIAAGTPVNIIAERHQEFLIHWWEPPQVEAKIRMLHAAGISEFADLTLSETMSTDPIVQKISYHAPGAAAVIFIWGINGWQLPPEQWLPPDTTLDGVVAYTPLQSAESLFELELMVPPFTQIDYAFQIVRTESGAAVDILDANRPAGQDYHTVVLPESPVTINAPPAIVEQLAETR
ncbi:MAG: hypothetical protein M9930_21565 [Anaerolineae bacterium]|nr:hypothetical protein [Anaerolineae bacterium]